MSDIPLKKPQLAEAMNWSVRQIEHFMHEGLPFIPYGKRQKRFDLESVKKWFKSREVCRSEKTEKRDVGMRKSASTANAYTEYCRKAQERKMQRTRKPNSESH